MAKKIKANEIGCTSEIVEGYKANINNITTKEHLAEFLDRWEYWIDSETKTLKNISDEDFNRLLEGIKLERKGIFSLPKIGEKFHNNVLAPLLMPEKLVRVVVLAVEYNVPDGLMFKRLVDVGAIKLFDDGNFSFVNK